MHALVRTTCSYMQQLPATTLQLPLPRGDVDSVEAHVRDTSSDGYRHDPSDHDLQQDFEIYRLRTCSPVIVGEGGPDYGANEDVGGGNSLAKYTAN
mmetsp:Transcript_25577/g.49794  ORF Transcript_25577/g.49794 Transcript_25577/m.49794 type:complete len:96 (-) Transcript_25577:16-303(-)